DVIHCHVDWIHLPLFRRLKRPFITTLHGRLDIPLLSSLVAGFPDAPFVSISNNQRAPLPNLNWVDTIYHGLPEGLLTANLQRGGYLAFLGRFTPEKGPHVAIRLAQKARLPLCIAAKIPRMQSHFSRNRSSRSSTAIASNLSARSMSAKNRISSAMRWRRSFRSTGPSRSGS